MFYPFTQEMIQEMMAASGTSTSTEGPAYAQWAEAMKDYAGKTNSQGLPSVTFWLVLEIPKKNFSEKIEDHLTLPLQMPVSGTGTLTGIARTQEELDKMTIPAGPDPKTGKTEPDPRRDNVYMTYKIKLQGKQTWRDLIEFCGEHDMLTAP